MLLSRSYCHLAVVKTPEVSHLIEDLGLECLTCLDAVKRQRLVASFQQVCFHNSLATLFDTSENGSLLAYYHYRKHHKFNPKNDLFYEESGKLF